MKSYLRHSKDRRVRGSANGASTVCVFPGRHKKIKKNKNKKKSLHKQAFFKITTKIIERGGKKKKKKKITKLFPRFTSPGLGALFPFWPVDGAGQLVLIVPSSFFRRKGACLKGEPLFLGGPACAGCAHSLSPRTPR